MATVRQVRHPREVPLAAMPLLFAFQQAVEGALWLQLPAAGSREAVAALSLVFLVFAKVLWPAYTALAVLSIEPDPSPAPSALCDSRSRMRDLDPYPWLASRCPARCLHPRARHRLWGRRERFVLAELRLYPVHLRPALAFFERSSPEFRPCRAGRLPCLRLQLFRDVRLCVVLLRRGRQLAALSSLQACRRARWCGLRPAVLPNGGYVC